MGYEYQLTFSCADTQQIRRALGQVPGAAPDDPNAARIAYRLAGDPGQMPEAIMYCEENGLYYCANTTEGLRYLGIVISRLTGTFGTVAVSEL
ncbi:hypothetical protein [Xanthomonas medicagonis]|uniref:hypothetical protein n=1 Tax=Xanthomonas medicagonis TaxID=3160841 RepID=UPI0035111EC4